MKTYFAPAPSDQESIVALVTREAAEECRDDQLCPLVLVHCVHEAVESLRDSHLTTFAEFAIAKKLADQHGRPHQRRESTARRLHVHRVATCRTADAPANVGDARAMSVPCGVKKPTE